MCEVEERSFEILPGTDGQITHITVRHKHHDDLSTKARLRVITSPHSLFLLYLVVELCGGKALDTALHVGGRGQTLQYIRGVCEAGMEYMRHAHGTCVASSSLPQAGL